MNKQLDEGKKRRRALEVMKWLLSLSSYVKEEKREEYLLILEKVKELFFDNEIENTNSKVKNLEK
jgi:hypothetical protein